MGLYSVDLLPEALLQSQEVELRSLGLQINVGLNVSIGDSSRKVGVVRLRLHRGNCRTRVDRHLHHWCSLTDQLRDRFLDFSGIHQECVGRNTLTLGRKSVGELNVTVCAEGRGPKRVDGCHGDDGEDGAGNYGPAATPENPDRIENVCTSWVAPCHGEKSSRCNER